MTNITAIVDLQFGSTGKGLIAGYLSQKNDYDVVVSANMPNAGHTFVDSAGKAWVNKVLPSGVYSKGLKYVAIGPGAVFDPARLLAEIDTLKEQGIDARVIIHPNAAILRPEHRESEQALNGIASTMQGSMEAMVQKLRRQVESSNVVSIAKLPELAEYVVTHREWFDIMLNAQNILMEGSQGYSLGINAGFYPYCTSRDCTVWRLLSDCGLQVGERMKVVGSARLHPIRVGNTAGGYSGDHYPDQKETSWEELGVPAEYTTVTKRQRRVFTFSHTQIREAMIANRVDEVFLNFCNYAPSEAARTIRSINEFADELFGRRGQPSFMRSSAPLVRYMGFGPQAEDIVEAYGHE